MLIYVQFIQCTVSVLHSQIAGGGICFVSFNISAVYIISEALGIPLLLTCLNLSKMADTRHLKLFVISFIQMQMLIEVFCNCRLDCRSHSSPRAAVSSLHQLSLSLKLQFLLYDPYSLVYNDSISSLSGSVLSTFQMCNAVLFAYHTTDRQPSFSTNPANLSKMGIHHSCLL